MYLDETDIVIKGRGLNYTLTRTYNSINQSKDEAFAYGWSHSYGMRLKSDDYGNCPNCTSEQDVQNGNNMTSSITYTDERGGDHLYLVDETTQAVTAPNGTYNTLLFDNPSVGYHTLTFRNGVKYVFEGDTQLKNTPDKSARLAYIEDPYGNRLNLQYDSSNRLIQVKDNLNITGRNGLIFSYTGTDSHIASVTDWSGRQWQYSYQNGQLKTVTNPLNDSVNYSYKAGSNLLTEAIQPQQQDGQPVKPVLPIIKIIKDKVTPTA
jgi:YD repeat-containing protein